VKRSKPLGESQTDACVNRVHDLSIRHHRVVCKSCGAVKSVETCTRVFTVREPAGKRNVYCGHFEFDPKAGVKQLWDLYRMAMAFNPYSSAPLTQAYPPAWFIEKELGLGPDVVKP